MPPSRLRYKFQRYRPYKAMPMSPRRDSLSYVMRSRRAKKNVTYGRGVTIQHDAQQQYRKKRMPRRKRRQWAKFVRKVAAVNVRNLGTRTVIFNTQMTFGSTGTQQNWETFCLYGWNSSQADSAFTCGNQDVQKIFNNDPEILKSGPPVAPINGKIQMHSAVMDVTICNNGVNSVEMDLYVIHHRKWVNKNRLQEAFVAGTTNTGPINPSNTNEITYLKRGVTPFDIPNALSASGIKIVKKTKYFVPGSGGIVTYQVRDPKNHMVNADMMTNNSGFAWPGKTVSILIVQKNITGASEGTTLNVGCTRKYSYTVESTSQAEDNTL